MKPFDLIHAPLSGVNLIEASAGTGKTYTISGLFLRLILEKSVAVDRILVVTFTKAATEELKDRIRQKLWDTRKALTKKGSDDPLLHALTARVDDPAAAILRIQDALIDFDKAPIFTIHGFCQRVLLESAFETAGLFDTALATDQTQWQQETVDDFWRRYILKEPKEFIRFVLDRFGHPDRFLYLVKRHTLPDTHVIPEMDRADLTTLPGYRSIYRRIQNAWPEARRRVEVLLSSADLKANIYGAVTPGSLQSNLSRRQMNIIKWFRAMDRFSHPNAVGFPLFDGFVYFTAGKLAGSVKKGKPRPDHPFFNLCDELMEAGATLEAEMKQRLLLLKIRLLDFYRRELSIKKQKRNVYFYDDLLLMVQSVLSQNKGRELATALRKKYTAVLVDEFQDTDTVQFDIFSRLFPGDNGVLFYIGDPKQAIYGFRGADIFAYLKAVDATDKKRTLLRNWRSAPGMIRAVNTLFTNHPNPFLFSKIAFTESEAAEKSLIAAASREHDDPHASLIIWHVENRTASNTTRAAIRKQDAIFHIGRSVAAEIDRLADPRDRLADPGQIAVLVRTNAQAAVIKSCLSHLGIPAVQYSHENVLATADALEMERLIDAIANPSDERRVKAALASDLLGADARRLLENSENTGWLEKQMSAFKIYHHKWCQSGYMTMFREVMTLQGIRERLLSLPDGERRLTNILHLSELLHHAEIELQPGISGLVKWLFTQRAQPPASEEMHQLRLESDENAVKIVTIHKSKGLEYEVVFCPYSWEGTQIRSEAITFHDPDNGHRLTLDLAGGPGSENRVVAQNELLAENMRLLYVALTRAKRRCYLIWGRINTAETSAIAYLIHGSDIASGNGDLSNATDWVGRLKQKFNTLDDSRLTKDLAQLAARSAGTIRISPMPSQKRRGDRRGATPCGELSAKTFRGKIDNTWKISSYSSMVAARTSDASTELEAADRDGTTAPIVSDKPDDRSPNDSAYHHIMSFPRGAGAGTFFHDLLENLDFMDACPNTSSQLIREKLETHGIDPQWESAVAHMIRQLVSIPLPADQRVIRLNRIPMSDRINEMEFHFPMRMTSPQKLATLIGHHSPADAEQCLADTVGRLTFSPARGYMKGYIDLVFREGRRYYLVDWKSNFLGTRIESYAASRLARVMEAAFYTLQYHLYTLALHLHLQQRLPDYRYEKHFGGCFYLFLKGIDCNKGPGFGIFFDRPAGRLITAMENEMIRRNESDNSAGSTG